MNEAIDTGIGFGPRTPDDEPILVSMQELHLTGTVLPIGATLNVRHVFVCGESEPIEAIYSFALPRDAALRQFQISGKDFSVTSELMDIKEAEDAYEKGIESGSLSVLSRVYRDGIVNLAVGNIRPGETVVVQLDLLSGVDAYDDGFRFRFPFALAPGYHPEAFVYKDKLGATEMELPEEFDGVILPGWSENKEELHRVSFSLEFPPELVEIASPSHRIRVRRESAGQSTVTLATDGGMPNRDVVLEVKTVPDQAATFVGLDGKGKTRFAALIPSTLFSKRADSPRRVVFLIDRSGSMDGEPMRQALASMRACLGALTPEDEFGIVAFDTIVESTGSALLAGDKKGRAIAESFIATIDARGGTELVAGIEAATSLLGTDGGGDILLVTDGQVMGTERIFGQAAVLGVHIHCLGIGSASQDRFLTLLARETGGTERFPTVHERVDTAALELFAAVGRPVASAVHCKVCAATGGNIDPVPSQEVHAGKPLLLFGSCDSTDEGSLLIRWAEGKYEVSLNRGSSEVGDMVKMLQGARLITDAEAHIDTEFPLRAVEKRARRRAERHLVSLSREYGLASRLVALVAIIKRVGDVSGRLPDTTVVPVGIPEGASLYSGCDILPMASPKFLVAIQEPPVSRYQESEYRVLYKSSGKASGRAPEALLVRLVATIEADGGIPGATTEDRILKTSWALAILMFEGNTINRGIFSPHIRRLVAFLKLKGVKQLESKYARTLTHLLEAAEAGSRPSGDFPANYDEWELGAVPSQRVWEQIQTLIGPSSSD